MPLDELIPTLPAVAPIGDYYPTADGYGQVYLEPYTLDELRALRAATLNKVARSAEARQQTIAGDGSVLPIVYGTATVGARVFAATTLAGYLVLGCAWCVGEVDAVSTVYINDAALPATVSATHYTGTAGQTANSTLVAAFAAQGKTYADTLAGVCYSVFVIPAGAVSGFPVCTAVIRGLKIAPSDGGTPAYYDTPAYAVADFIESTTHGMRKSVDWSTVADVATANNTLLSGEKTRLINLALDTSQPVETWLKVLCDYAGCWAVPEGDSYRLIVNATGAAVASFDASIYLARTFKMNGRSGRDSPTVVEIGYTDASAPRARTLYATAYAAGVEVGTTPRRLSRVSRPGTTRYSEAYRVAVERVNEASLNDMTVSFTAFDDALAVQFGDLIAVTHPAEVFVDKLFRVAKIAPASPGRWEIVATEHDPAVYSTTVASAPSVGDIDIDNPAEPPAMSSITLAAENYQLQDGTYATRIRATWTASTYTALDHYRVMVWQGGVVVETGTADKGASAYVTAAVQQLVPYQIDVQIVSPVTAGTAASATITPDGKTLAPGDVPSFRGFEAGGKVYLWWGAAVDLDIWRYELRYGTTGGSWDTATLIDRIDALNKVAEGLPAGTWRFYVKAIDSVGNESSSAPTLDLTITLDGNSFLVAETTFESPTLSNMTTLTDRFGVKTYVTDFGDGLGYGADDTNNSTGTFGDSLVNVPFASPHTAGTSSLTTESWDAGESLTGNWTFEVDYDDLAGTASVTIETSPDNSTWTSWPGGSGKTTARYARGKISTTGAMLVRDLPTARLDVVPREETGVITTSSSGASTVSLAGLYAAARSIQLTPKGTVSRQAVYDNVVLSLSSANSFDVYLFNSAGTQIAGDVSYVFQGI